MTATVWPKTDNPASARLIAHAKAAEALTLAKAAWHEADEAYANLSQGEHPDVLQAASDDEDRAFAAYQAAKAVEATARLAYTDPQGRGRAADTVPVYWPGNGSLDPALTLG